MHPVTGRGQWSDTTTHHEGGPRMVLMVATCIPLLEGGSGVTPPPTMRGSLSRESKKDANKVTFRVPDTTVRYVMSHSDTS